MQNVHQILIKPILTEKTSRGAETGKYAFVVSPSATKIDVKNAIRSLYGVKAVAVNIFKTKAKSRIVGRGREITKRSAVKNAIITLEKGKTIDIYKFEKPAKK